MHLGTNIVSEMTPQYDPRPPVALVPGCLSMICGAGVCCIGHKSRKGEGDMCAAINFYTSNKPQVTDYTFNHLSPPLTRLELTCGHCKCPPSRLSIHSSELCKDEYHTTLSFQKNISCYKSNDSSTFPLNDCIHDILDQK